MHGRSPFPHQQSGGQTDPDGDPNYKRRKRLWIIGGVIAFFIILGVGLGSLGAGLIYNLMNPSAQPEKPKIEETKTKITLKSDGTYLYDGQRIPGDTPEEKMDSLRAKIMSSASEDLWNRRVYVIYGEEDTQSGPTLEVIQAVQDAGGFWEMTTIE